MNTIILTLLIILVLSIGYAIFLLQKKQIGGSFSEKILLLERDKTHLIEGKIRLEAELERKSLELGELKGEIKKISKERDEIGGKYETILQEKTELQSMRKYLEKELTETKDILARHTAEEIRKQKEFEEGIHKLANAEKALEDERQRIRREDEKEQTSALEEQTRIWNDHEQMVLARLREACQKPSFGFTLYDNTTLPNIFTKLKPDAVIEFLSQYVVFDAKKSKSIRTYIPDQVKSTARKYKDIPEIYRTVFFIVPANELQELKTLSFIEEGFTFFIISPESIEPILASLRKITEYDTIADFDPQDRETIVNLIASYDRHISLQNATNILFTRESIGLMNSQEGLHPEIRKEIMNKKENMRTKKLNESELKKIAQSMGEQERQVEEILSPKITVGKREIEEVQEIIQ
ncbi:MAG: hypothetical protein PHQ95_00550 [Candidatus Gracilibacteria bacterium]|nr:hypothetical protein [Candidatus Gracilibacteria bacterium]